MDCDDEPTYQYFTIKNEEENPFLGIHDILNIPSDSDENKQIFYLTFDGNSEQEEGEEIPNEDSVETEPNMEQNDLNLNTNDVKLITLADGRMFVTTGIDQNLESLQTTTPLLVDGQSEAEQDGLVDDPLYSTTEEDADETETNYQLVELADGSQAVIKIYKISNDDDTPKEEPPKKVKKFHCLHDGCDKVYATSYHLTVHMRSHTDCKPYGCTIEGCGKRFSTNYSLKAHIRTHTGEKPYGCYMCDKHFKTSGDLQKHIRIHTGEKPFVCPIEGCGKSFTTTNIRKVHIRSHTGERPYSCDYPDCGKAFTSSTNYKNHLRIHSGEKPYVCPVEGCGKRFTEYSSLYKHNAVHLPVRPHVCIFCGHKFKQESALNFHKRLKHNVVVTKDGTEIIVKIE